MMRQIIILIMVLAAATCAQAAPRHGLDRGGQEPLPPALDGSMSLYDFSDTESSALPDSLTPLHICYAARHGARFLTSESKIRSCEKLIQMARERGSLTEEGKLFAALLDSVREHTAGRWGMLSPVGIDEERRLGRGMAEMFPEVFGAEGARVTSVASYVPRVVESMDQFTVAIAEVCEGIYTSSESGKRFDRLTRFFVSDPGYDEWRNSGSWKRIYDDFVARNIPIAPAIRLLGGDNGLTDRELRKFVYDMYKVLQGMRAASLPAPDTRWMTEPEYRACWEATNLEKYFQYSVSPLSDIPARGAVFILYDWLNAAVRLEAGELAPGLSGIFGHAETLLPLFALLGIDEAIAMPDSYDNLSDLWNDSRLTPLGANIAVIFARGPSGKLYASMRLNGRNISPVGQNGRPVVPLAELKSVWLSRLASLDGRQ